MLAPEAGSTNADGDKTPLVQTRPNIFRKLSNIFTRDESSTTGSHEGYIEFGTITEQSETRTLGTFAGCFSPVTLSMFSALLFLRMGYLVGNAGLLVTLLQFFIAYTIQVFTIASVCAISTNGAVEGGGAYFMISRTLGPEFGGAIGTLFFLANVVSSALCISGCVEGLIENLGPSGSLLTLIPDGRWWNFLYCSGVNTLNLIVCLIGAGMFAKTSVFILATVCTCLGITFFSFFYEGFKEVPLPDVISNGTAFGNYTGISSATFSSNMYPHYGTDYTAHNDPVTFASVFGVLFTGVTGIMAGANMSGELKNPGKSIPIGTLSAVLFTLIVYIGMSLLTAATCSTYLLQNNYLFLAGINVWQGTIAIGLITATWSAALTNVIGASRVLEALAKDKVFGRVMDFITKGTWNGNPIAAVIASWVLVEVVLLIGSLNLIAQLNSVLFLLSYFATNMACLGLELASAPNFRPSFTFFTWHTAFIGLMGTLIMMFVISPIYAACSILLCFILFVFLHLFSPSKETEWGSISQALMFHQVRKYLLKLDSRKDHVKFWRPQILLLVNSPRSACPLIDFINDLKKGGLYVLGHVMIDNPDASTPDPTIDVMPHWLNLVDHLKVKAFIELTVARSVREGFQHLMRLSGMGAMKPNTVVLGFLDKQTPQDFLQSIESSYQSTNFSNDVFPIPNDGTIDTLEYVQMMEDALRFGKNLCVCRNFYKLNKEINKKEKQYIDVWPINFTNPTEGDAFDTTSLFMMQMACIVNMVSHWSRLTVRICVCNETRQSEFSLNTAATQQTHIDKIKHLLKILRINAEIFPVTEWNNVFENFGTDAYYNKCNEVVRQLSDLTAVTFIYLPSPPKSEHHAVDFLTTLETVTNNLPPTILIHGISTVTSTTL